MCYLAQSAAGAHIGTYALPATGVSPPDRCVLHQPHHPSQPVVPVGAEGAARVDICHMPSESAEVTLMVSADAVAAHVAHGDYVGTCAAGPTTIGIAYVPLAPEPGDPYNDKVHEGAVAARDAFGTVLEERTPLPDADLGDVVDGLSGVADLVIGTLFV
jgi:hypothetical protein